MKKIIENEFVERFCAQICSQEEGVDRLEINFGVKNDENLSRSYLHVHFVVEEGAMERVRGELRRGSVWKGKSGIQGEMSGDLMGNRGSLGRIG